MDKQVISKEKISWTILFYTYKGLFVLIYMREMISRLTIKSIEYDNYKYHQIINYCYHAKICPDYDKT